MGWNVAAREWQSLASVDFGSRLLERMTASEGGTVSRTFDVEGLTCTLRFRP